MAQSSQWSLEERKKLFGGPNPQVQPYVVKPQPVGTPGYGGYSASSSSSTSTGGGGGGGAGSQITTTAQRFPEYDEIYGMQKGAEERLAAFNPAERGALAGEISDLYEPAAQRERLLRTMGRGDEGTTSAVEANRARGIGSGLSRLTAEQIRMGLGVSERMLPAAREQAGGLQWGHEFGLRATQAAQQNAYNQALLQQHQAELAMRQASALQGLPPAPGMPGYGGYKAPVVPSYNSYRRSTGLWTG